MLMYMLACGVCSTQSCFHTNAWFTVQARRCLMSSINFEKSIYTKFCNNDIYKKKNSERANKKKSRERAINKALRLEDETEVQNISTVINSTTNASASKGTRNGKFCFFA